MGRVDNPVTNFRPWDEAGSEYWKSAGVQAYDPKNAGPIYWCDVIKHGDGSATCAGTSTVRPVPYPAESKEYTGLEVYWHGIQVPYGYSAAVYRDGWFGDLQATYIAEIDSNTGRMKCDHWDCEVNHCPGSAIMQKHPE